MCSQSPKKLLFAALAFALALQLLIAADLGAQPLLKRGGVDVVGRGSPFSLEVGVGAIGTDGFEAGRFALQVTPRYELRHVGPTKLELTLPIVWIPDPHPDPREAFCLAGDVPGFRLASCPGGEDFTKLDDLELGPSIILAPSLEWTFRTDTCFQPSVFVGAGVRHGRGRATLPVLDPALGLAVETGFETEDVTSPLVTFGAAFKRPLKRNLALRFEARAITTFYDEETFTVPDGPTLELESETVTSAVVTVGLQFGF